MLFYGVEPSSLVYSIYLVDHAWTYNTSNARQMLTDEAGLLDRMCALMDINSDDKTSAQRIDLVTDAMWKFNQTYSFAGFGQVRE